MKRVSRDITPTAARDLLERVPRACVTYAADSGPQAQPVVLIWRADRYHVGLAAAANPPPEDGQEVVLLVDEGVYFFTLRAIYVRGQVQRTQPPENAPDGYTWFELLPQKTIAWDYGKLHEVNDEN